MSDRYDVAIIGGGVVGVSIAFAMRALGSRLAVIDGPGAVRPASRANFGLVWVQGKGEHDPAYAAWTLASARAWPQLAADLREATGLDVALRQAGGVHVCLSHEAHAARASLVEHMRARGFTFPGQKGGFPEGFVKHDLCHVLAGFDTDPAGDAGLMRPP